MGDNRELHEKTERLLKDLNYFLAHIVIYFFANTLLTLYIFNNLEMRSWMFFFIVLWALAVLYHALRVYGIDLFGKKRKKLTKIWSWV